MRNIMLSATLKPNMQSVIVLLVTCSFYNVFFCLKSRKWVKYYILSSIVCTFMHENDAEIFPPHYTWKVTDKGFKMAYDE
jgi:hypothetical protein